MPPPTALFAPAAPPDAWNLPFQPVLGSQTSTWMFESFVGLRVATTRQNEGSDANAFPPRPPRPCAGWAASGGVKAPAAITSARTIAVSGSFTAASSSQLAAAGNGTAVRAVITAVV